MRILSWLVLQFRRARARCRGERLFKRYEYVHHTCGVGPVALGEGESCPFCNLSWTEALRDQYEFERLSKEAHLKHLEEEDERRRKNASR